MSGGKTRLPPRWFVVTAWYVHRWMIRATGGRMGLWRPRPGKWGALRLTTTGRRSGEPRTVPLLYLADGSDFIVMASNFGQPSHPAWSANLLAHPDATVTVGGQPVPVRAELAQGEERVRLVAMLKQLWPAYASYEVWAANRTLRVFRLTPR